jgi:hypothetical protein
MALRPCASSGVNKISALPKHCFGRAFLCPFNFTFNNFIANNQHLIQQQQFYFLVTQPFARAASL